VSCALLPFGPVHPEQRTVSLLLRRGIHRVYIAGTITRQNVKVITLDETRGRGMRQMVFIACHVHVIRLSTLRLRSRSVFGKKKLFLSIYLFSQSLGVLSSGVLYHWSRQCVALLV
jgi:hypothetical protein